MGLFENPSFFNDDPTPRPIAAEPEIPIAEAVPDAPRRSWLFPALFAIMGWAVAVIVYLAMIDDPKPEVVAKVEAPVESSSPVASPPCSTVEVKAAKPIEVVTLPMPRVMQQKTAAVEEIEQTKPVIVQGERPSLIEIKPEHYRANKNGHQCAWNSVDTAAMTVGRADPRFSSRTEGFTYHGPLEEMADQLSKTIRREGIDVGMVRNKATLDKTVNDRKWPVIVGLKTGPKKGHALLVVGVDAKSVYIVDNMHAELSVEKMDADEFADRWTGSALAIAPKEFVGVQTPIDDGHLIGNEHSKWEEFLKTASVREIGPEEARMLSQTRGGSVSPFRVIYAGRNGTKPASVVFSEGKAYMVESDHYPPVCVPTRAQLLSKMSPAKSPGEGGDY